MFHPLITQVTVSVLFVPLQGVSVVLLPAVGCQVREKDMMGVSLVVAG